MSIPTDKKLTESIRASLEKNPPRTPWQIVHFALRVPEKTKSVSARLQGYKVPFVTGIWDNAKR